MLRGRPMIGPENAMNLGHKSPSSKESAVPETAPTANRIAAPLDHRSRQVQVHRLFCSQPQEFCDDHEKRHGHSRYGKQDVKSQRDRHHRPRCDERAHVSLLICLEGMVRSVYLPP